MDKVVILLADDHLDRMSSVVAALRDAGLVVDDVLETVGTVTGSIDPGAIPRLESVRGVAGVERQRDYQLPPPDSDRQ